MTGMEKAVKNVKTVLTWARYGHIGPYNCEKVKKLLAEALEENIKTMRMYAEGARKTMKSRAGQDEIYVQAHGMASGAEFAEALISKTLGAAKKQREKLSNE